MRGEDIKNNMTETFTDGLQTCHLARLRGHGHPKMSRASICAMAEKVEDKA